MTLYTKLTNFTTKYTWVLFFLILVLGLYLRFYRIETSFDMGWDQARDAWTVRDIIRGQPTLQGPKTGIGNLHLAPLYYYFLVPFMYVFNLDPMALNYANILVCTVNFIVLFLITKKIFNAQAALFTTLVYATSRYLVLLNRVPWNVSFMPGLALLIFYGLYQIYQARYKWVFVIWTLAGFFFNFHFTAIFLPPIIIASLIFVKDKWRVIKYSLLSIPLYAMWFVPNILYELQKGGSDYYKFQEFWNFYYHGFHFRFLLYRLPVAVIQFETLLYRPLGTYLKFLLPLLTILLVLFEKDKKKKLLGYLISLWFIIPLIGFTLYGGPVSDYYFLSAAPLVLFAFIYLQQKLLKFNTKIGLLVLIAFWSIFLITNTRDQWIKSATGGLRAVKDEVRHRSEVKVGYRFNEGDIRPYLYAIWVEDGKRY